MKYRKSLVQADLLDSLDILGQSSAADLTAHTGREVGCIRHSLARAEGLGFVVVEQRATLNGPQNTYRLTRRGRELVEQARETGLVPARRAS